MANYYRTRDADVQQSEATTAYREFSMQVGTSETKAVTISQAGAAFTTAAGTATVVEGLLFRVSPTAADFATLGTLDFKLAGATDTDYVYGMRVVPQGPDAAHIIQRAVAGTVATDSSANTVKTYDTDNNTVLATLTKTTAGTVTTWTQT